MWRLRCPIPRELAFSARCCCSSEVNWSSTSASHPDWEIALDAQYSVELPISRCAGAQLPDDSESGIRHANLTPRYMFNCLRVFRTRWFLQASDIRSTERIDLTLYL